MARVTIRVGELTNIIPLVKFGLVKNPNDPAISYPAFKEFYAVDVTLKVEDQDDIEPGKTAYKVRALNGRPYWIVVTHRISENDIDLFSICENTYVKV